MNDLKSAFLDAVDDGEPVALQVREEILIGATTPFSGLRWSLRLAVAARRWQERRYPAPWKEAR